MPKANFQLSVYEAQDAMLEDLRDKLKNLDINALSPIEALLKLNEMKQLVVKK